MPIVCIAAQEAVEVLKAQPAGPLVEWPGGALLPVGDQVMLAKPRRVVAVAQKNIADGACALGNDRVIARIASGKLGDIPVANTVMIAAGQQRGARWRTQCGSMELIVANPLLVNSLKARSWDRAAEGAGRTEASIIGQDQQHV